MTASTYGYTINKTPIYSGRHTTIVSAIRDKDHLNVVIKQLKNENPSYHEVASLKHEYEVAKLCAASKDIIQVYAFEQYGSIYTIVMENISLPTLNEVLGYEKKMGLNDFLQLSIATATALSHVHQNGIIHKNINPFNIMCDFEKKQVKIIDFSLSSMLPKEHSDILNPKVSEYNLEYISPEQTGRINRSVDYRTDYYSMGIIFYQMLTGKRPFSSGNPMELVNCHIALDPKIPHIIDPTIPEVVSGIVMKLLEKNADNRYQSIDGLISDLENCSEQLTATGSIKSFPIGIKDSFSHFKIPEKLYGRDDEINILRNAYDRVTNGSFELILVGGLSGVGKTSLVNEACKSIIKKHNHLVLGKFDKTKQHIPYVAITQALNELVRQILMEPDEHIAMFRNKILDAVEGKGKILLDIIPDLIHIIGEQHAVEDFGPSGNKNRLSYILQKFIKAVAMADHPLVIFLDDLEWADLSSNALLNALLSNAQYPYLLIIGCFCSNEINPSSPLMLLAKEVKENNTNFETIELESLEFNNVIEFIMDIMHQEEQEIREFARICYDKTDGNAFFLVKFILNLYKEQYIYFDAFENKWKHELGKIQDKIFAQNIETLLNVEINNLPAATQQILQYAACIGNQFNINLLTNIFDKDLATIRLELHEAIQNNFIFCYGYSYSAVIYHFEHNYIQQIINLRVENKRIGLINIELARVMLKNTDLENFNKSVFCIANHYNYAVSMGILDIIDEEEKNKIAEVNIRAAKMAKKMVAFESALNYSEMAMKCKAENSWDQEYSTMFDLYAEAVESSYLIEEYDLAEKYAAISIHRAKSIHDRLRICQIQTKVLFRVKKHRQSVEIACKALVNLGVWLPANPKKMHILFTLFTTKLTLFFKNIPGLLNLPEATDPDQIAIIRLVSSAIPPSYVGFQEMVPILACTGIKLSLKYGNTYGSDLVYVIYGSMLCGVLSDVNRGIQFGELALNLMDRIHDPETRVTIVFIYYAFIEHWKNPIRGTLPKLVDNFKNGLNSGAPEFACYSILTYGINAFFSGMPLKELVVKLLHYQDRMGKLSTFNNDNIYRYIKTITILMGEGNHDVDCSSSKFDEEQQILTLKAINERVGLFHLYFHKIIRICLFNKVDSEVIELIEFCDSYIGTFVLPYSVPEYNFYKSLSMLAIYESSSIKEKNRIKQEIASLQKKKKGWAEFCPANYLHQYLLIEAEQAWRIDKKTKKASDLYEQAIAAAGENKFINYEALGNELAAKFYVENGKEKIASAYMEDACYLYGKWGADAKVTQLEENYPELLRAIAGESLYMNESIIQPSISMHLSSQTSSNELEISEILKSAEVIFGSIVMEELFSRVMKVIMENSGAQKSYLLLKSTDKYYIEAEGNVHTEGAIILNSIEMNDNIIPSALINYVNITKKYILIDDSTHVDQFTNDPYVVKNKPKSILCMPLFNQGVLIGILYMENNIEGDVFTNERIKTLELLASQVAIAIDNAKLYSETNELNKQLISLNAAYERFVPNDFLSFLGRNSIVDIELGNQVQRIMAVLFTDIRNFTSISENMTLDEDFIFVNSFFNLMGPIIKKHGGFIDKYIGDAIMALYPNGADDAVQCAIEMWKVLQNYNSEVASNGGIVIEAGIGIHIGNIMLGIVGEANRINATVISDVVDISSETESLTKKYKVGILITEETYKSLKNPDRYNLRLIEDNVLREGEDKKIKLYQVE